MKKIYILWGKAHVGKSTTLNDLAMQLLQKFPNELIYFKKVGHLDFLAIWKHQNIKIGIYSGGDNKDIVFNNISFLHGKGCNYIIGATRTRGGSCDAVASYHNLFYGDNQEEIYWIEKTVANDIENTKCKNDLYKIVKQLLTINSEKEQ